MLIRGVSGSTVTDGNTDRVVKAIPGASDLASEFVKLSAMSGGPCRACKACVEDNVCKIPDDVPALAERVRSANTLLIGG